VSDGECQRNTGGRGISTGFQTIGVSLSAEARTPEDIAEILLMVMTVKKKAQKK
jgi:hypothetical protein